MPTTPWCQSGLKKVQPAASPELRRPRQRLLQHLGLDVAPLAVQPVELLRAVRCARLVVGDQALDAEAHVGEAPGGVEARPGDEAEVEARGLGERPAGGAQQRRDAGRAAPGAQALQALRDQVAVVRVERHHVGDGAERDQVGERGEVGLLLLAERFRVGAAPRAARASRRTSRRRRRAPWKGTRSPAGSG